MANFDLTEDISLNGKGKAADAAAVDEAINRALYTKVIDTTLTLSGKAADAAVVGRLLANIQLKLNGISDTVTMAYNKADAVSGDISELEKSVNTNKDNIGTHTTQIGNLEKSVKNYNSQIEKTKEDLSKYVHNQFNNYVLATKYKNEIGEPTGSDTVFEQLSTLANKINNLDNKYATDVDVKNLTTTVKHQTEKITNINNTIGNENQTGSLIYRIKAVETKSGSNSTQITAILSNLGQPTGNGTVFSQLGVHTSQISSLSAKIKTIEDVAGGIFTLNIENAEGNNSIIQKADGANVNSVSGEYSALFGTMNFSQHNNVFIAGHRLMSSADYQTIFGTLNDITIPDAIFMVGNGYIENTNSIRDNAFTIYNNNSIAFITGAKVYDSNSISAGRAATVYSKRGAIIGGGTNIIGYDGLQNASNDIKNSVNYDVILGGYENTILYGSQNTILSGWRSTIGKLKEDGSYIGSSNSILAGCWNILEGGSENIVQGAYNNVKGLSLAVFGGRNGAKDSGNKIGWTDYSGTFNTIGALISGNNNYVGIDGVGNKIGPEYIYNVFVSGKNNVVTASYSGTIGQDLYNTNSHSLIIGKYSPKNTDGILFGVAGGGGDGSRKFIFSISPDETKINTSINLNGTVITPTQTLITINNNVKVAGAFETHSIIVNNDSVIKGNVTIQGGKLTTSGSKGASISGNTEITSGTFTVEHGESFFKRTLNIVNVAGANISGSVTITSGGLTVANSIYGKNGFKFGIPNTSNLIGQISGDNNGMRFNWGRNLDKDQINFSAPVNITKLTTITNLEVTSAPTTDNSAVRKIDLNQYYTSSEVDKAISNVKVDLSNYYTKTEVNNLIEDVDVDLSNYYTKTETTNRFYTKTQIDSSFQVIQNSHSTGKSLMFLNAANSSNGSSTTSYIGNGNVYFGTNHHYAALSQSTAPVCNVLFGDNNTLDTKTFYNVVGGRNNYISIAIGNDNDTGASVQCSEAQANIVAGYNHIIYGSANIISGNNHIFTQDVGKIKPDKDKEGNITGYRANLNNAIFGGGHGHYATGSYPTSYLYGSYNILAGLRHTNKGSNNALFGGGHIANGSFNLLSGLGNYIDGAYKALLGMGLSDRSVNLPGALIVGQYNDDSSSKGNFMFEIGYGTSANRKTVAAFDKYGTSYCKSHNYSGLDYAEYFEWKDQNPNQEDRIGYIVTLNENKIQKAISTSHILGIISGTASAVGNSASLDWYGRELKDEWGRTIYENILIPAKLDDQGNIIVPEHYEAHAKVNPNYDPNKPYIPRSERPEWAVVGLLGQILTRDDGTCVPGGYAKSNDEGIATHSDEPTNLRVMERTADNIIRVFLK